MKLFSSRLSLLLALPLLCTAAGSKCYAAPGDITHSTVSTYRVAGWQNQLTSATPNLNNYYWEPITKRIINTTKTTSRQAIQAPTIVTNGPRYIKPIHTRMPSISHPQPQIAVAAKLRVPTTQLTYSTATQPVLSYNSTGLTWSSKRHESTATSAYATKESVYGILKSSPSSTAMRAKAQSL